MTRLIDGFHVATVLLSRMASCADHFSHQYQKVNEITVVKHYKNNQAAALNDKDCC
jgi:hypothetical protein